LYLKIYLIRSARDHALETGPEHALAVERQRRGVHDVCLARVFHHFGIDAIAGCARLVHDIGEHHRLSRLEFDALRERRVLARLDVVGDALDVLERAVVAPDLARLLCHAPIDRQFLFRDGHYVSIYVSHKPSVGSVYFEDVSKKLSSRRRWLPRS